MDNATLTRLLRAADKVEIIELLSRYHQAIDANDWEALPSIFTADAECHYLRQEETFGIAGSNLVGLAAIREFLVDALTPVDTMHSMTNHVFTMLEEDRALTRSYLTAKGGTLGIYDVDHVRTADGWRIRRLTLDEHFEPATLEALREQRRLALEERVRSSSEMDTLSNTTGACRRRAAP
jgi:hypothetical protein